MPKPYRSRKNRKFKLFSKFFGRGFTLVELIIAIVIISVLAITGFLLLQNVTKGAKDAKRKADIDAISKAYEIKYNTAGSYQALADEDFTAGKVPVPPEGGSYFNFLALENKLFRICAALENNSVRTCSSPSSNCYCRSSTQTVSADSSGGGLPPDHPSSCDPDGILSNDLAGYWRLDESSWNGSSGEIIDSSGYNNNDGISAGAVNVPAAGLPAAFKNAGSFDGSDDYLEIPESVSLFVSTKDKFTISAWTKIANADKRYVISGKDPDNGQEYSLQIDGGAGSSHCIVDDGTQTVSANSSTGLIDNNWHQVACTFDWSGNVVTYIDGQSRGEAPLAPVTVFSVSGPVRIGKNTATGLPVNGLIDDVRFYRHVLSPLEIDKLYNEGEGCIPL